MFICQSVGFWYITGISMRRWTSDPEVESLSLEEYSTGCWFHREMTSGKMLVYSALLDSGYTRTRQSTELLHNFIHFLCEKGLDFFLPTDTRSCVSLWRLGEFLPLST